MRLALALKVAVAEEDEVVTDEGKVAAVAFRYMRKTKCNNFL